MSIPLLPPNDVPSNSSPSASITSSSSVPFDVISPSSTNGGGTPILPPFPAFSTPAPIPAGGGGGGDGSNNGGGLPSAGPNIASSASLYPFQTSSYPPYPPLFSNISSNLQTPHTNPNDPLLHLVYTFLATLVLLLGVSASIVVRSLILRRRHRRMMEEAIRNGTWIPPAPTIGGHTGRVKVDLSKKPKMFEVWLGGGIIGPGVNSYGTAPPSLGVGAGGYRQYDAGTGTGLGKKTHRTTHSAHHGYTQDWESINPFSAAYISPPTSSTSNSNVNALSSDLGGMSLPIGTSPDRGPGSPSGGVGGGGGGSEIFAFLGISSWSMPSMPSPGIWAGRILRRIRRPGSSMEQQQQQQQHAQQMVMATTTSHGGITNGGLVDMDSKSGGGRPYVQTMRVAVMIAMPSPSTSTLLSTMRSHSHPTATGSHPPPPTTAPSSSSSSSSANQSPCQSQVQSQTQSHNAHNAPLHEYNYEYEAEDDQPLPHVEFGIADVPIMVVEGQRGRHSDDDDQGSSTLEGKVGRRRSFGFGGSEGGHGRDHDHDNEQGLILEDVEMEEMDVGEMRRRV
ncbi:hypothetical protein BDN72DRAFT_506033 [Pluteus cervinus]|uniref:Uncharacterized protein n=1 Tax=Pluteus cervinus TaxID=181527 RepID=A0ACD3A4M7_9AGAR|nr:hypothetical protein BDN72DRAFT_506033 [Pluteus cervinus]